MQMRNVIKKSPRNVLSKYKSIFLMILNAKY